MRIKELQEKYNLTKDDFWEVRIDIWVISHDACEKIADTEKITFAKPDVHLTSMGIGMIGEASMKGLTIWATGEASPENVKMAGKYYWSMAEKRLKDRLTLKLIRAYEYGIYSETESESFKNTEKPKVENANGDVDEWLTELQTLFPKLEGETVQKNKTKQCVYMIEEKSKLLAKDFVEVMPTSWSDLKASDVNYIWLQAMAYWKTNEKHIIVKLNNKEKK